MPKRPRGATLLLTLFVAMLLGYDKAGAGPSFEPAEVVLEAEGLRLEAQRWVHAGQAGTAWRVRLPRRAGAEVVVADSLTLLPNLTSDASAPYAAINGGFYDGKPGSFEPMGLVVSGGKVRSKLSKRGGSGVVFYDGEALRVRHRDRYPAGADEALQSIDRIVDERKVLVTRRDNQPRAPRSAVAITEDAVWLIVLAADQTIFEHSADSVRLRRQREDGLTLWAFARYIRDSLDARYALNLDGGISTQLVVRAGDDSFTVHGQQGVLNGLVVRP